MEHLRLRETSLGGAGLKYRLLYSGWRDKGVGERTNPMPKDGRQTLVSSSEPVFSASQTLGRNGVRHEMEFLWMSKLSAQALQLRQE